MMDIFGLLETNQWLALLRIVVGLWWIKSFLHKPLRKFVSGQMSQWTLALADNHPMPAFGKLIRGIVAPTASWFPYLILGGEIAVGLGLTFGLFTPISAIVAIFMNLNYLALAGVRPKDLSVNAAYQSEQGQNLMMIASEIIIFVLAAGSVWSLDSALGLF